MPSIPRVRRLHRSSMTAVWRVDCGLVVVFLCDLDRGLTSLDSVKRRSGVAVFLSRLAPNVSLNCLTCPAGHGHIRQRAYICSLLTMIH